jgi:uncharacterized protein YndB with AHSA1/START domain
MKDVVTVEIDAPREEVAKLFADPRNSPKWMEDLAHYEPLSGRQGMPGSTYRLAQKNGKLVFEAKVVARDVPREVRLKLDSPDVAVAIQTTFFKRDRRTRLVSTEHFRFKGVLRSIFGLLAKRSIHRAHARQMQAFKRFAESRGP